MLPQLHPLKANLQQGKYTSLYEVNPASTIKVARTS